MTQLNPLALLALISELAEQRNEALAVLAELRAEQERELDVQTNGQKVT